MKYTLLILALALPAHGAGVNFNDTDKKAGDVTSEGGTFASSVTIVTGNLELSAASARVLAGDAAGESTPAFSFVGDPNTGAYQDGADSFVITTNGSQGLRVAADNDITAYNQFTILGDTLWLRESGGPRFFYGKTTTPGEYGSFIWDSNDHLKIGHSSSGQSDIVLDSDGSVTFSGSVTVEGALLVKGTNGYFGEVHIASGSASTTTITAGVFVKPSGTCGTHGLSSFTESEECVLRYDGASTRTFKVTGIMSMIKTSGGSDTAAFAIGANGNCSHGWEDIQRRYVANTSDEGNVSFSHILQLATNDTVQPCITTDGGDDLLITHMTFSAFAIN